MNILAMLETLNSKARQVGITFSNKCKDRQLVPDSLKYCRDCGSYSEMCVVHDSLWEEICGESPVEIFLCFHCMEQRLGRKLALEDLKPVLCNTPYFLGSVMPVRVD